MKPRLLVLTTFEARRDERAPRRLLPRRGRARPLRVLAPPVAPMAFDGQFVQVDVTAVMKHDG